MTAVIRLINFALQDNLLILNRFTLYLFYSLRYNTVVMNLKSAAYIHCRILFSLIWAFSDQLRIKDKVDAII